MEQSPAAASCRLVHDQSWSSTARCESVEAKPTSPRACGFHETPATSLAPFLDAPYGERQGLERVPSSQPKPRSAWPNHGKCNRGAQTSASSRQSPARLKDRRRVRVDVVPVAAVILCSLQDERNGDEFPWKGKGLGTAVLSARQSKPSLLRDWLGCASLRRKGTWVRTIFRHRQVEMTVAAVSRAATDDP
ncbi:hypothetical protein BR93DRAFT_279543 [Coniochaeta sp. PMI_546]|nr:hypothetical protein BR93DRAFT_279543 [Coniochaeta sp. PMI_546]